MHLNLESLLRLIHESPHGYLATHSLAVPHYPFVTVLPFAPDERHCPIFLVSGLAEHTKNLKADPRASFLIAESGPGDDVQAASRLTLIGDIEPVPASRTVVARYLRYQPAAERCLKLPDFHFFRLKPRRLRMIEGFGRMGWDDASFLSDLPSIAPDRETELVEECRELVPAALELLGIDRFGIDLRIAGMRRRIPLADSAVHDPDLRTAVANALNRLSSGS